MRGRVDVQRHRRVGGGEQVAAPVAEPDRERVPHQHVARRAAVEAAPEEQRLAAGRGDAGQAQLRSGGASYTCTSGSWQAITDPDTEITTLHFEHVDDCFNLSDTAQACTLGDAALLRRQVRITLAARSRSDPNIVQEITHTVAIANDKLFSAYP